MTDIDVTNVVHLAETFAAIVIPLAAAWVSKEISSVLRLKADSAQAAKVQQAVNTAATLIVNGLHAASSSTTDIAIPVQSATVADGVQHVLNSVPDAIDHLGVKPATVANLVQAQVARLTKQNETAVAVVAAARKE